jgi:hypothetical protein
VNNKFLKNDPTPPVTATTVVDEKIRNKRSSLGIHGASKTKAKTPLRVSSNVKRSTNL